MLLMSAVGQLAVVSTREVEKGQQRGKGNYVALEQNVRFNVTSEAALSKVER